MKLTRSGYVWIPLFHIPIPDRHNPIIFFPTTYEILTEAEVVRETSRIFVSGSIEPSFIESRIREFLKLLSSELDMEFSLRLRVKTSSKSLREYTYVHATNTILELLGGKLDSDIIEAAWRIDSKIGLPHSVFGLRLADLIGRPYIWRFGEEYVEIDKPLVAEVTDISEVALQSLTDQPFIDYLTHLAGNVIISVFSNLREEKDVSKFLRLYNALWYVLYGVQPPKSEKGLALIFPDIDKAFSVEVIIK
ncbi:MAG: hypothetical protein QXL29_00275 [Zestosphaera sp.]